MNCRNAAGIVGIFAAAGTALLMCCLPTRAAQPGDQAPPLQITRWLKGEPVRLADGRGQSVYVIHFWSTRSPQCADLEPIYTALQNKLDQQGVVCIAVTGDSAGTVEKYLEHGGERIGFRVALDDRQATFRAYMDAAGVRGIPHAFIVGRDGRIAWHGHPLDDMERVLDRLIAEQPAPDAPGGRSGQTDREELLDRLKRELNRALLLEDWEEALEYVDRLIEIDPKDRSYIMAKLHLLIRGMGGVEQANRWGLSLVETHRDDPDFLNELAWRMLTIDDYGARCVELAYAAAEAADQACGGIRSDIADTLARALYQIGRLDDAIRVQEKAIELAAAQERETNPAVLQEMKNVLRYYRDCAATRDKAK